MADKFKDYKFNIFKSPQDLRDYICESIYPKVSALNIPDTLDYRNEMKAVRDQNQEGSCAAMASSSMKEWQELKNVKLDKYFSPQFLYNLRENYPAEGMCGRDLMDILTKRGCCLEDTCPYLSCTTKDSIKKEMYQEALNYRIQGYAQVTTLDGLKTALYKNGPCIMAVPVYNFSTNFWKQENPQQNAIGGHMICIVGYTKDTFIIRNSWGVLWGNLGHTYFPFSDFGCQWEIWTTIDDTSTQPDKSSKCCSLL